MSKEELQALIAQGEGLHLDFKESINTQLAKTISSFANAKGGKVLLGVSDAGEIKKKKWSNADYSKIQSAARDCDPPVSVDVEALEGEPMVLIVNVKEGKKKPYRCTSGFYLREGASSNKRKTEEIRDMFEDAAPFPFDDVLCPKVDFDKYFNPKALEAFMYRSGIKQIASDVDTLHNLGVLEFVDGKPVFNSTGVLFFTKEPIRFISQALIQCVRYDGIIKLHISDQKDLDSDIATNIDDCFVFLKRSLDVAFKIESGSLRRKEIWEVPEVALREALVNAIAHRNYTRIPHTHIQVEVFDDRVSITNFGGFIQGFTEKDLGKKTAHRNPNMVNILHRADFIEKLGTGILRINEALFEQGMPEAEFEINEHWFSIIFKRKPKVGKSDSIIEELTDREVKILEFCFEPKKRSEIFEYIGLSNQFKNYKKNIIPLIEMGYLAYTLPNSPNSPNQMYKTSKAGLVLVTT